MSHQKDFNMAAPTFSHGISAKSKQNKTEKQHQGSGRKVSKKNILLSPFQFEWPQVDTSTEDRILGALILKLKEFPRLEKERQQRPSADADAKNKPEADAKVAQDKDEEADTEDDLIRKKLRFQLAIGHRQVCKGLERDQLSLVLVWGAARPLLLIRSLLPLAASRACPTLCLQKLMPTITDATGLSSLIAIGFKKSQPGLNDFASFVSMATSLAPPLSVPWMSQEKTNVENMDSTGETTEDGAQKNDAEMQSENPSTTSACSDPNEAREEEGTADPHTVIDWPVLAGDQEKELLDRLTGLLMPYKAVFKKPKPRFTSKEWKSQRKTIRGQLMMDVMDVSDAARSGRLDLLLVQNDDLPNLTLTSATLTAVQRGCPVLHLTSLRKRIVGVVRNPLLKAVGFRKQKDPTVKRPQEFTEFIAFASRFVSSELQKLIPPKQETEPEGASEKKTDAQTSVKKTSQPKKTPIPFYDVSHLYVYKTDTNKTDPGAAKTDSPSPSQDEADGKRRKVTLSEESESYISLSSEPTVQILGLRSQPKDSVIADCASVFVDTKGSSVRKMRTAPEKAGSEKGENSPTETAPGGSRMGVMGLESTAAAADPTPFYPEPNKSESKASLKRKLSSSAQSGDFLSFKLTPTNVQTSVSNPSKKKKEKKKKKR